MRPSLKAFSLAIVLFSWTACSERPTDLGKALAVVNGKQITENDVELRWSQLPEHVRKKYAGVEGRKKFLDELVDREMLLQEAKKRGMDEDRILKERVEHFKEQAMLDALRRAVVDAEVPPTSVEELKAYYDAHRENFVTPEEFRVSHILVKSESEAADLRKRIANREDFAALAKKASLDTLTKAKGGDLGMLKKGQALPEFEQAITKMKPGEVSEPVATQFGYHLIKLVERVPGPPLSFEDAKDRVKEHVSIEKKLKRLNEFIASLRADAKAKGKLQISDAPLPGSNPPVATPSAGAQ